MGLAGRKTKQRIGADPRNLTWSDDSSKFGAKYLQSLGWTAGTGLGVSGEGRIGNLNIHQKLDLMGIGANRHGPDGDDAGWRGGREFEGLLARLNQAQDADPQDIPVADETLTDTTDSTTDRLTKGADYMVGKAVEATNRLSQPIINEKDGLTQKKRDGEQKRKRKRLTMEGEDVDAKRRRKEEKKEKKQQRKAEKAAKKLEVNKNSEDRPGRQVAAVDVSQHSRDIEVKVAPRYRAHRARNLASKRLAAASATGMNEILGITSSAATRQKMETSSTQSPTLDSLPRQPPVKSNAGQTGTGRFSLSSVDDPLAQRLEADDTNITRVSAMDLGSHSTSGGGLGFCGPKAKTTDATQGDDGNDLLRKNGKSVAEYFAEKMRMKGMAKNASAFNEGENTLW